MKNFLLLLAIPLMAFGLNTTSVEYQPDVTVTDLGSNQYEVKIEVLLPAGESGAVTLNQVNGSVRSIDIDVVGGVPINGQHLETYTTTVTRETGEDEINVVVYGKEKPKKKKGEALYIFF